MSHASTHVPRQFNCGFGHESRGQALSPKEGQGSSQGLGANLKGTKLIQVQCYIPVILAAVETEAGRSPV